MQIPWPFRRTIREIPTKSQGWSVTMITGAVVEVTAADWQIAELGALAFYDVAGDAVLVVNANQWLYVKKSPC